MSIEAIYYASDVNIPNYKPKIVKPDTYFCYSKDCKGKQVILFKDGELKPCPKCGGHAFFTI